MLRSAATVALLVAIFGVGLWASLRDRGHVAKPSSGAGSRGDAAPSPAPTTASDEAVVRSQSPLGAALRRLQDDAAGVRRGPMARETQDVVIMNLCRAQGRGFGPLLRDLESQQELLEAILGETDPIFCHGLGFALREDASRVQDRLRTLAAGGQREPVRLASLAALGTPRSLESHVILDATLRSEPEDSLRLQAARSYGSRPHDLSSWQGVAAAVGTLRHVVENDTVPAVRGAAAQSLVAICGRTPELEKYLTEQNLPVGMPHNAGRSSLQMSGASPLADEDIPPQPPMKKKPK
jgi:hypothetical protein